MSYQSISDNKNNAPEFTATGHSNIYYTVLDITDYKYDHSVQFVMPGKTYSLVPVDDDEEAQEIAVDASLNLMFTDNGSEIWIATIMHGNKSIHQVLTDDIFRLEIEQTDVGQFILSMKSKGYIPIRLKGVSDTAE